jgi:ABC-type multidrug transport system fused ATPase/permease subunit
MQDNTLFNASIKENLRFANNEATDKELEDAIKKAEADFVFKLDK